VGVFHNNPTHGFCYRATRPRPGNVWVVWPTFSPVID
jgi:hypothetical protein